MNIPEDLRHLVDQLGEALVRALVEDPRCHDLTQRIQASGFDLSLSLEAVVVSHSNEADEADRTDRSLLAFSRDDETLLRTFRIALD